MKRTLTVLFGISAMSLSALAQPDPGETQVSPNLKDQLEVAKESKTPLSDAQILGIVEAVNDGEIRLSRTAKSKASNDEVRNFAKQMVDHHQKNNDQIDQLSKRMKVSPEKTVWSQELQSDVRISDAQLDRGTHPDNRDSAYINKQIEMHAKVLDRLDNTLIPQAKNEDLKTLLQNTRATVSHHLTQARSIQSSLSGRTASAQNER